MRKLGTLLASVYLIAFFRPAISAQSAMFEASYSSITYASISISTYAATRVDNVREGAVIGVLSQRNGIELDLSQYNTGNSTGCIVCGYNSSVSTDTASAYRGQRYCPVNTVNIAEPKILIDENLSYWCMSELPQANKLTVIQYSKQMFR